MTLHATSRTPRRSHLVFGIVLTALVAQILAMAPAARGEGSPPAHAFREGAVLVGFEPGTSAERRQEIHRAVGATVEDVVGVGTRVLRVPSGSVQATVSRLQRFAEVRYAEPDYILHADTRPNDPGFTNLWGLENSGQVVQGTSGTPRADIAATGAWDVTTGSRRIVVGVVDTGVDYTHADLAANTWSNNGSVTSCPTGSHGYNAITNSCDPRDDNDHGTHVAGTIGAVGNNGVGVAGVNWESSIMGLKFLDATGTGATSDAIEAINWAINAKLVGVNLQVLNNSWGGGPYDPALLDVINRAGANNILFVASAGNSSSNNDGTPSYPCSYDAANIVCVAATDNNDQLASFSNYGATQVDLAAPGVQIYSTRRYGLYMYKSGTSMAAPHVAGAAALMLTQTLPPATVQDLRTALLASVDPVPSLSGKVATGGRLNVCKGIATCVTPAPVPDFTLSATPASQTVIRGKSTTYSIGVNPRNGYQGLVTMSISSLPSKVTASFSPNPAAAGSSSTLTLNVGSQTRKSSYILTVIGTSPEHRRTMTIRLTVA